MCLFHFLVHAQPTHILCFRLTGESGRTERKKNNGLPCSWFSFILGISDWPVDGSCTTKKECNRVSRSFTFPRRSLSSKVEASSGSNGKHDLSQLSIFLLTQRCLEPNGVHVSISRKFREVWTHCTPVLTEHSEHSLQRGQQEQESPMPAGCSLLTRAPQDSTHKHSFRD